MVLPSSASVSMASDSLPSLGREGVVRSRMVRFFRFLTGREMEIGDGLSRDLAVRVTEARA